MQEPWKIIMVSQTITNRVAYVTRYVASQAGISIKIVSRDEYSGSSSGDRTCMLSYGREIVPGAYSIFSAGLLSETGIRRQDTGFSRDPGQVYLYPAPAGFDLPFDLFSAIFFLLSRYEEYLPFIPDRHDRFEANQSLAWQEGFIKEPVIDQWIGLFIRSLERKFPGLQLPERQFMFISTIDIDNPWAYLHKGLLRSTGGLLKSMASGRISDFRLRLGILTGKRRDPYQTYDFILEMEKTYQFRSLFFFLCANYGGYDTNYALNTIAFQELVKGLDREGFVGIHPSYRSYHDSSLLQTEYRKLGVLLGRDPLFSRQHFLLLRMPETYRLLISLGIRRDYSMGYASCAGFRAGTSRPFNFYDLERECETELEIVPFSVMDVTLQQYMSLSPGEAAEEIVRIMERVKAVAGTFTSLWHNESLSETGVWKGWRQVFERLVKEGTRDEGQGTRDEGQEEY